MILATLATEIQDLSEVFLTVNVWFKGRQARAYIIINLMTKSNVGFDHKEICRIFEIIPRFHLYITEINSKNQSSFPFGLKIQKVEAGESV